MLHAAQVYVARLNAICRRHVWQLCDKIRTGMYVTAYVVLVVLVCVMCGVMQLHNVASIGEKTD